MNWPAGVSAAAAGSPASRQPARTHTAAVLPAGRAAVTASAIMIGLAIIVATLGIFTSIVDAFQKHGFVWGGKWLFFDTMHFEYRPELLGMSGKR